MSECVFFFFFAVVTFIIKYSIMLHYQWNNNYTVLPSNSNSTIFDNILSNHNNNNNNVNNVNMVNGGVSQILDYDIQLMSDFIIKCGLIAFNNPLIDDYGMNNNNTNNMIDYLNKLKLVLDATRLPKVTIFQSLDILFKYLNKIDFLESKLHVSISLIYQHIIISFVLANKFNDDKTFTNKSWSQATGIPISDLNNWERNWLSILNWRLFDDKFASYGILLSSYENFITEKQIDSNNKNSSSSNSNSLFLSSSPLQSPSIIKDTDFTNRNGGFNYDYYIFGQGLLPQLSPSPSLPQQLPNPTTTLVLPNSSDYQYYSTIPLSLPYQQVIPQQQNYISASVPLQQCLIPHPQVIPQQQENYQLDPIHPLPKIYNNNNSHTRNNITNTNLNNNLYWNQNINAFNTVIPAAVNNNTNNFYCPDLKSFNMINPMNNINYNIVY